MIELLLNWAVLLAFGFTTGYSLLHAFEIFDRARQRKMPEEKRSHFAIKSLDACLMAGILAFTVYAQFYSLFGGVSRTAFLILAAINLALFLIWHKDMIRFARSRFARIGRGRGILLLFLFVLFLYGSSRGYLHFDTGLYHAQAIRWIEEYGLVPGLGNLHNRFAYNSSAFPLTALFSMGWLFGQSLHGVAGFMAFVLASTCTRIRNPFARQKRPLRVSDFARLAAILYLAVLYREMVSPASDYYATLALFYLVICWLDALERREKSPIPFGLLCLFGVFAATLKLSAAVICLLAIQPAVMLFREKRGRDTLLFIALGILTLSPYLIRNALISGWIFYPFTFPDLFQADWKIPKGAADSDAIEIRAYAKQLNDVLLADTPLPGWFPDWFARLRGLERAYFLGGIASFFVLVAYGIRAVCKRRSKDIFLKATDWLLLAVLALCWCSWFFGAPLVRYGYAFVLLFPFVTVGYGYARLAGRERGGRVLDTAASVLFLLILIYKAALLAEGILETAKQPYYVRQMDYGTYEATTYEVDGVTFYVPVWQGQIGYDKFPSSPYVQEIELRGDGIEDGFRKRGSVS